eukprot:Phypoly_transcript_19162.p1 GENE.Phypoly_transcript_19162~~Phypoly_transcript_19162.p1  ORF type:complete len:173 (+),score=38.46 Phypoly_transcript_19162:116-634(+)
MGQLNSVTIPADYKDIITPDDRVFSHLRIFVTQKYHYSENDHHYSLVRRKVHGTLAITPTDLYLFRHRSLVLHVRLDDKRWLAKQIRATYENNTLEFSVDIKAFQQEIKQSIFSPPPKFEFGTLMLACVVALPPSIVDILCNSTGSPPPSPSPSPSPSFIPTPQQQVIQAAM